jgi:hypothetical protein
MFGRSHSGVLGRTSIVRYVRCLHGDWVVSIVNLANCS